MSLIPFPHLCLSRVVGPPPLLRNNTPLPFSPLCGMFGPFFFQFGVPSVNLPEVLESVVSKLEEFQLRFEVSLPFFSTDVHGLCVFAAWDRRVALGRSTLFLFPNKGLEPKMIFFFSFIEFPRAPCFWGFFLFFGIFEAASWKGSFLYLESLYHFELASVKTSLVPQLKLRSALEASLFEAPFFWFFKTVLCSGVS